MSSITVSFDCGCIFSDEDVFRNQALVLGAGCTKSAHATFEADPIPVAAVAREGGDLPARIFAMPCPNQGGIIIFYDEGTLRMSEAEARRVHAVIGGALDIIDGQHPAQTDAYAAAQQSTDQ